MRTDILFTVQLLKNGSYKQIGTVKRKSGAMTGSYTDKNVKIGKKYYYKVVTYKNISGGKNAPFRLFRCKRHYSRTEYHNG